MAVRKEAENISKENRNTTKTDDNNNNKNGKNNYISKDTNDIETLVKAKHYLLQCQYYIIKS